MKSNSMRAAVAGGILWGACLFAMTMISVYTGYAAAFLNAVGSLYPGYTISIGGSIVGLIYGFLDAFVGVYLAIWVYTKVLK